MPECLVLPFPSMTRKGEHDLPNRIRALRKAQDLTLSTLGGRAGLTAGHLQKLEVGDRELTLPVMERIAAALGVSVADLLPPALGGLDAKERRIIDTYREVPGYLRGAIEAVAEGQQPYRGKGEVAEFPQDDRRSA